MTKHMTEDEIKAMAKAIVGTQKAAGLPLSWGTKQHIGLLANVALELSNRKAAKLDICKTLDTKGLGGNASQFRQWLNSDKGLGKSTFPEANLADYA